MSEATSKLPVVVVGAGPIGLAAAAHLLERGLEPLLLEAGPHAGTAVREWGHVRLFSPWSELVDPAAARRLTAAGWTPPDGTAYPTGAEWAARYLQPLAEALGERVRYGVRVTGVARRGRDRGVDAGRGSEPFTIHVEDAGETSRRVLARAVVDASGTWATPGPAGADGLAAFGEQGAGERVSYRMPDLDRPDVRRLHAGRSTMVVGRGHSAQTAVAQLAALARGASGTSVTWVLRRDLDDRIFGGGADDQLARRGALGSAARALVADGSVAVAERFRTAAVERLQDAVALVAEDGRRIVADRVVVLTGFRPDTSWLTEVRLDLDPVLGTTPALAPLIDPNVHSCGTVPPHGAVELAHPEPDLYVVGMKSYGRAPTFLALTGYEQVRSVAAAIAGDRAAAERVELVLPETGVCGGAGGLDGGGCCSPAATLVPVGTLRGS